MNIKGTFTYCFLLLLLLAGPSVTRAQEAPALGDRNDSLSYAMGMSIMQNFLQEGLDEMKTDMVGLGMKDFIEGSTLMDMNQARMFIQEYYVKKEAAARDEALERSAAFLQQNASKEGVVTLPSGLQYEILVQGEGAKPGPKDTVETHYTGRKLDGSIFDSSVQRGQTVEFPLDGVIKGWTEALQLMPVGSKWKLYIPPYLAYGERGYPPVIGPNEALIFEVELISIK